MWNPFNDWFHCTKVNKVMFFIFICLFFLYLPILCVLTDTILEQWHPINNNNNRHHGDGSRQHHGASNEWPTMDPQSVSCVNPLYYN